MTASRHSLPFWGDEKVLELRRGVAVTHRMTKCLNRLTVNFMLYEFYHTIKNDRRWPFPSLSRLWVTTADWASPGFPSYLPPSTKHQVGRHSEKRERGKDEDLCSLYLSP